MKNTSPNPKFSIYLNENRKVFHDLSIEDHRDGQRSVEGIPKHLRFGALGNLTAPGSINFRTPRGKIWCLPYGSFKFLFSNGLGNQKSL